MIILSVGERVDFDFFDIFRNNIEFLELLDENNRIYEGFKSSEKYGDVSFRVKEKKYFDFELSDSEIDSDVDLEFDKLYSLEGFIV